MPVLSLKLPLLHLFRSFQGKDVPNFLDFFVLFRSSDLYTHQNPLLLLFHSVGHRQAFIIIETPFVTFVPIIPLEKMSPNFLDFFVLFRSSDLYTHQNPSLLLFHSAGHRQACIIIETPFVTFVPVVPLEKMSPNFLDFFVLFRSSDLYTHQNPSLLLFHSAGHKHACIIIETPFVTFVLVVPWKRCPHIFGLFRSVSFQ